MMNPMQQPMGMEPEGMEPEGMEGEEGDPQMQEQYEDLHYQMAAIVNEKGAFDASRQALAQGHERGTIVEDAAQWIVHILDRVEKDTGPLPDEMLMQLGEDLSVAVREWFGIEVSDEEIEKIMATAVGLWMKHHEDRVDIPPEDAAMVEQELSGMAGQMGQQPGHQPAPQQGLLGRA